MIKPNRPKIKVVHMVLSPDIYFNLPSLNLWSGIK